MSHSSNKNKFSRNNFFGDGNFDNAGAVFSTRVLSLFIKESAGGTWVSKKSPGKQIGVPKSRSAAETPSASLGADLMPIKTQGNS